MSILAVIIGFAVIILLNIKKVNMAICLLLGAATTGVISGLKIIKIFNILFQSTVEPMTLRLIVIVAMISGLGWLLKENRDLDIMMDSLYKMGSNHKILTMVIPAIIGILSIPGGAILSAPLIKKSADKINLSNAQKTSVNLFFGHIVYLIYPLCNPIIVASEVSSINRYVIIKYNLLIFLVGFIVAYFTLFNSGNFVSDEKAEKLNTRGESMKANIIIFIKSFSPIFSILLLSLIFKIPFQYAVFSGLLIGAAHNLEGNNKIYLYWQRIKEFFRKGVNYKLVVLIIAIMYFQAIIEKSGALDMIVGLLTDSGISLILIVTLIGIITGYLTGLTIATLGILVPIFLHLFPAENILPYFTLLFNASFIGYVLSPLHVCFLLTKEYFDTKLLQTYRYLGIPLLFMILTAIFQVIIFT